jgi:hypothetical protein
VQVDTIFYKIFSLERSVGKAVKPSGFTLNAHFQIRP